jgi:protocatechuate 3,4-dioxygenase beta subunit
MMKTPSLQSRRRVLRALFAAPAVVALSACAASSATPAPTAAPDNTAAPGPDAAATEAPVTAVPTAAPAAAPPTVSSPTVSSPTVSSPTAAPVLAPTDTALPVAQTLPATPACDDNDEPTPAQTEGPYYTPSTPQRASFIEAGMQGTRMQLRGLVLDTACKPVAKALIDLWHCDAAGVYDNSGYRLRGHFFTDDAGAYAVETIVPGLYPGRTRHFHVKVQAPNQPVLTTQLYFPNEPQNARDGIYREECLMEIADNADGSRTGSFNFVLNLA